MAHALRRRGIDVTTALEVGPHDASDAAHLEFARNQGRVVVTHDRDFLVLASQGASHLGICYCHSQDRAPQQIVESLVLIHQCSTPEEMIGQVRFL